MGFVDPDKDTLTESLSARRAWIEITDDVSTGGKIKVALRKESVDRNSVVLKVPEKPCQSLSARRAWIEIDVLAVSALLELSRSPQGERG